MKYKLLSLTLLLTVGCRTKTERSATLLGDSVMAVLADNQRAIDSAKLYADIPGVTRIDARITTLADSGYSGTSHVFTRPGNPKALGMTLRDPQDISPTLSNWTPMTWNLHTGADTVRITASGDFRPHCCDMPGGMTFQKLADNDSTITMEVNGKRETFRRVPDSSCHWTDSNTLTCRDSTLWYYMGKGMWPIVYYRGGWPGRIDMDTSNRYERDGHLFVRFADGDEVTYPIYGGVIGNPAIDSLQRIIDSLREELYFDSIILDFKTRSKKWTDSFYRAYVDSLKGKLEKCRNRPPELLKDEPMPTVISDEHNPVNFKANKTDTVPLSAISKIHLLFDFEPSPRSNASRAAQIYDQARTACTVRDSMGTYTCFDLLDNSGGEFRGALCKGQWFIADSAQLISNLWLMIQQEMEQSDRARTLDSLSTIIIRHWGLESPPHKQVMAYLDALHQWMEMKREGGQ